MDQKLVAVKNVKNLRFPWKWEVSTWPAVQLLTPPGKIISNELHISDRLAFRDNSLSAPAYPITSNRKKITLYCWREILMFWFVASFVGFFLPQSMYRAMNVCMTRVWKGNQFKWPVLKNISLYCRKVANRETKVTRWHKCQAIKGGAIYFYTFEKTDKNYSQANRE